MLAASGCRRGEESRSTPVAQGTAPVVQNAKTILDPCALVLVAHAGEERADQEIRRLQAALGQPKVLDKSALVERLGWLYVAKARASFDPGFYKLAQACADCLETSRPECAEGLLLRGHVLHNLHHFQEAEPIARKLVARRGLAFDYGLLGDVLLEQGHLAEAVSAYQKMMDLKPDLHSYARAGQLRWLKGDVSGALEALQMAAQAASPLDPESAAWIHTRLAQLRFQKGDWSQSQQACEAALEFQKDYAPALLLRGRMLLSEGKSLEAIAVLERASRINPLLEYQWLLAEALREANRKDEASLVETQLGQRGAAEDPRTFALYLATRGGESAATAVTLAEHELRQRGDVFTHDALAWSLAAAGRTEEARQQMQLALTEGTQDGRLFFHATIIAAQSGQNEEAQRWFEKTIDFLHMLLPSELEQLQTAALQFKESVASNNPLSPAGN